MNLWIRLQMSIGPNFIRRRIIRLMSDGGTRLAAGYLADLSNHIRADLRKDVIRALSKMRDVPRHAVITMAKCLRDHDPTIRSCAHDYFSNTSLRQNLESLLPSYPKTDNIALAREISIVAIEPNSFDRLYEALASNRNEVTKTVASTITELRGTGVLTDKNLKASLYEIGRKCVLEGKATFHIRKLLAGIAGTRLVVSLLEAAENTGTDKGARVSFAREELKHATSFPEHLSESTFASVVADDHIVRQQASDFLDLMGCKPADPTQLAYFNVALNRLANLKLDSAAIPALTSKLAACKPRSRNCESVVLTLAKIPEQCVFPIVLDAYRNKLITELAMYGALQEINIHGSWPVDEDAQTWRSIMAGSWRDWFEASPSWVEPLRAVLVARISSLVHRRSSSQFPTEDVLADTCAVIEALGELLDFSVVPYVACLACNDKLPFQQAAIKSLATMGQSKVDVVTHLLAPAFNEKGRAPAPSQKLCRVVLDVLTRIDARPVEQLWELLIKCLQENSDAANSVPSLCLDMYEYTKNAWLVSAIAIERVIETLRLVPSRAKMYEYVSPFPFLKRRERLRSLIARLAGEDVVWALLLEELSRCDDFSRATEVVDTLIGLGWQPESPQEMAWVTVVNRDTEETAIRSLGPEAIRPLLLELGNYSAQPQRKRAVREALTHVFPSIVQDLSEHDFRLLLKAARPRDLYPSTTELTHCAWELVGSFLSRDMPDDADLMLRILKRVEPFEWDVPSEWIIASVRGLARFGDRRAIPSLIDILFERPDKEAYGAKDALLSFGKVTVDPVAEAIVDRKTLSVQAQADSRIVWPPFALLFEMKAYSRLLEVIETVCVPGPWCTWMTRHWDEENWYVGGRKSTQHTDAMYIHGVYALRMLVNVRRSPHGQLAIDSLLRTACTPDIHEQIEYRRYRDPWADPDPYGVETWNTVNLVRSDNTAERREVYLELCSRARRAIRNLKPGTDQGVPGLSHS